MDTQQQRETHQVQAIQNVSGDELKHQAWLQHRRRLIVWLHWKKEKEDEFSANTTFKIRSQQAVDVPYEEAVEKARAALKEEGFGVLCEIDIKEKLKEKLGVDFRKYLILGACNPALAYKTLQEEISIGCSCHACHRL